jgi:hypothetical protein
MRFVPVVVQYNRFPAYITCYLSGTADLPRHSGAAQAPPLHGDQATPGPRVRLLTLDLHVEDIETSHHCTHRRPAQASMPTHPETPHVLGRYRWRVSSSLGDCRKCQTVTATPAEPGDLPWMFSDGRRHEQRSRLKAECPGEVVLAMPFRIGTTAGVKRPF